MYIEAIKIDITTESKKKYGCYVSFVKEDGEKRQVNLIYGKNNLGKSTLIKSIIYALNGEDLYGKSTWSDTNFPPIMKVIDGEAVIENFIYLQIINPESKRVVIRRDALGREETVVVFQDVDIADIHKATKIDYYKAKKDTGIEGNKTFQNFLFEFFKIPEIQFEGSKIYFQNIMPLFVVPQTAWDDIQAANPNYNIPDVKHKAFEIILNLSSVQNITEKLRLKLLKNELKEKRTSRDDVHEIISLFKYKSTEEIKSAVKVIEQEVEEYHTRLKELESGNIQLDGSVQPYREDYRKLKNVIRRYKEQINGLSREINEYYYRINKIKLDIEKIDKLKTAKKLISSLPIENCPHCLNQVLIDEVYEIDTNNCSLCGNQFKLANISKSEQLYGYLLDEMRDFERIKNRKELEKHEVESKLFLLELDIEEIEKTINEINFDLKPNYLKQYQGYSSEIGRLNNTLINLKRENEIITKYEAIENQIITLSEEIAELDKKLKETENDTVDSEKLQLFEDTFKEILRGFDFLKEGFDNKKLEEINEKIFRAIKIDRDDFKPKIEGKNLYNITSSSGLIRILISYYLGLLVTCLKSKHRTNHPLILILDEPRQQNLDEETFVKFTELVMELVKDKKLNNNFQIIFTCGDKGVLTSSETALDLGVDRHLIQLIEVGKKSNDPSNP
ncbi:hypothetical protein EDM56_28460 [Brevibacillus fluminis]|uniref:Rad50/SbcC-type AAA domain-containing protein n=2 Tax=Brevibacillus fluminis TaxID=511487 RepID=A0A3M8CWX7_9BACL|nr:hypothetical protein EDM56_28460 [Brevibacillus fluminis]